MSSNGKPVKCIVIDGWHKGHIIVMPNPGRELRLMRPRTITIDDCCDGEAVADIKKGYETYQLAFGSIDQETALYSTDGGSKQFWEHRDWISPIDKNWLEQPLYVGIHDYRGSIDFESLDEVEHE